MMNEQNQPKTIDAGEEVIMGGFEEMLPPSLKTTEFTYPIGEEEPLPDPSSDGSSGFERLIDENDLLPAWFLERGAVVQRAIARVVLAQPHTINNHTFPPGTGWATGFMVSPSLFLTNNHVIHNKEFATKVRMQFNYQLGPDGLELPTQSFFPIVDSAFHTNAALDYTLIRLQPTTDGDATVLPGERWGMIKLNPRPVFRKDQHFNIIQHPKGRRKEISVQDNEIDKLFTNITRYKSDTEQGSSGSPVFDNLWQLVALHHAGGDRDATGKWLNNEGIRIDRIVEDLRSHFGNPVGQAVLEELSIG
ncbi:MAG: serine protease [Chloroflexota bacterium]